MLSVDRDALLCDLAETYHVYDFNALPVTTLAVLSFGLRENSRIKQKINGVTYIDPMRILAATADKVTAIHYALTNDDETARPYFFATDMYEKRRRDRTQLPKFASSEDFKQIWSEI